MIPDLIYDIGFHQGEDTAYYLFRGYRVVAVEADPGWVEAGRVRFEQEIESGLLTLLHAGISDDEEIKPFWVCDTHPEWSSFDRTLASRQGSLCHSVEVPCSTFGRLLKQYGVPYYLKVDIEGMEGACLRALDRKELPAFASVECSQESERALVALDSNRVFGYRTISQINFLPLETPFSRETCQYLAWQHRLQSPALFWRMARRMGGRRWFEEKLAGFRRDGFWDFPFGSSGPFGDKTPGRWQPLDEMRETLAFYRRLAASGKAAPFWLAGEKGFWADIHIRFVQQECIF
ncbi:MAG: hypothetical protein A2293_10050 [Elusimicrobia bacterium RIFOXYB2_FULL_49_7]|nr:MAG: hypothetical protein A2293_10050 [Elusimicrobia bacterium RIFOXYB2_FULL_49_7]